MSKISRVAIKRLLLAYSVFALMAVAVACYQSFRMVAFSGCVGRAALASQMSAVDEIARIDVVNAVCEKVAKRQSVAIAAMRDISDDIFEFALCIVAISFIMVGRDGRVRCGIKGKGNGVHWIVWLLATGFVGFTFAITAKCVLLRLFVAFAEFPIVNTSTAVTLNESLKTYVMLYERGKTLVVASLMCSAIVIGSVIAAFGLPLVRLAQVFFLRSISNGIGDSRCRVL